MTVQIKAIGNVTFIVGPAGAGKTTKMFELVKIAATSATILVAALKLEDLLRSIHASPQRLIAIDEFTKAWKLEELANIFEETFPEKNS
jgi:ABC-type cobalamin transport system ATPase subunit